VIGFARRTIPAIFVWMLLAVCAMAAPTTELEAVGNCRPDGGRYLPLDAEEQVVFSEGLCPVKLDGLWGYIDTSGLLVIEPSYDAAGPFREDLAEVETGGRRILIDRQGNQVLDVSVWDEAVPADDEMILVRQGKLWGAIDRTGQVVIEPAYDTLELPSSELLCASKDGKYGFINSEGRTVIDFTYDYAESFAENAAYVEQAGKGMLIDYRSVVLAENVYSGLSDGLALTMQDGLWGFVDLTGAVAIPCTFSDAEAPQDGLVRISMEGLWGVADLSGAVVIEPAFDYLWPYEGECALYAEFDEFGIEVEGYGYVNRLGERVTKAKYEQARHFSDGYAAVFDGEKWGYIDESGNTALAHIYDYAADFSDGYAAVAADGVYSLIDHEGKALVIHREGELPDPSVEEESPEQEEPKPARGGLNIGALIVLVITFALIIFIAGVSLIRSVNIRRRRQARRKKEISFPVDDDNP